MSTRQATRRPMKKTAVGDLRDRITLKDQEMTASDVDFGIEFNNQVTVWAAIFTPNTVGSGQYNFGGTNTDENPTHIFKIRYRDDVDGKTYVEHENINYRVVSIQDPDLRREFLHIKTVVRGDGGEPLNLI
tara:strand:+ start:79 stop:471 length:393 start_codon:yes stop_codon:yes gene_type:complete